MPAPSRPVRSPAALGPISSTPRRLALEALLQLETDEPLADLLLDRLLRQVSLAARDRNLAWELTYGVLRHRANLDWRLDQVSDRPLDRVPSLVRNALRLGAYQLLHLSRIPASAAVNESVQLVKTPGPGSRRDWSGYVNAVLRALMRTPAPSLPALDEDPVAGLSLRYSCPPWLTQRWLERYGVEGAAHLCQQTLQVPPVTLRVNRLKASVEDVQAELQQAGLQPTPTRVSPVGLVLDKAAPVWRLPQFEAGRFYIEDEAAQLVPLMLDPQAGERILDACAAPGGKATHLAALMQNRGEIVALDQSRTRLQRLDENCRRLGVTILTAAVADVRQELRAPMSALQSLLAAPFDRILLDAPCSGLGVLRRHPEAKWQRSPSRLPALHDSQLQLLTEVAVLLRPGGVLVYSTCTTEPEENEEVIAAFCRAHSNFQRDSVSAIRSVLPAAAQPYVTDIGDLSTALNSESMDGFFAARLRRLA